MALAPSAACALGADAGQGNLLGLQPALAPADYVSAGRLYARLAALLDAAERLGWLGPRTVAVLPEYLGTWLVALGAPLATLRARTALGAMLPLVLQRLPAVLAALPRASGRDRLQDALFRASAPTMSAAYHAIATRLAARYRVTLVAGTIVLPDSPAPGAPLTNAAFVYRPDGVREAAPARKIAPIDAEQGFTAPGRLADLPVYTTPAGRLGVAVCADSWYPEVYAHLRAQGAELLAVPSYLGPDGVWSRPWGGYNPGPPPADVDISAIGAISEGQAWRRYAMGGRASAAGMRAGINVFLRGSMWDFGSDGRSLGVRGDVLVEGPAASADALVNVWLA